MVEMEDWSGSKVRYAKSSGGVIVLADFSDNLIRCNNIAWPPAEIVQKLQRSAAPRFDEESIDMVTGKLGYFTNLQSIHSEDAITWSYFGVLSKSAESIRVCFLNALCHHLELEGNNSKCSINLWRRIPHPDRPTSNGPEIDFSIIGDRTVIIGEAKWLSGEAKKQGVRKDKGQLQLRKEFLEKYSTRIFGQREPVLLYVGLDFEHMANFPSEDSKVKLRRMTWSELSTIDEYPNLKEFQRYYEWKLRNGFEKKTKTKSS